MSNQKNNKYLVLDFITILLILLSIGILIIQAKLPTHFQDYETIYRVVDIIIITGFGFDYFIRITRKDGGLKYIFSFGGIIDFIAFAPSVLGLIFGLNFNSTFLRALRLIRLSKIFTLTKYIDSRLGVFTYLIPYLVAAVAFKGIIVVYESSDWWPVIGNLNTVVGVTGFAVAIAMGTKLSVVNGRIYAIEDAICRVIGSLRDIENAPGIKKALVLWSTQLENALKVPASEKPIFAAEMRLKTDELEKILNDNKVGGPATAGFHRDVAFLLHRITASSPAAFDHFLRFMTVIYSVTLIFIVPGLTGLFSSILVVLSLGGVYFINEDMDNPLDYSEGSLFDVRLDALEQYNQSRSHLLES